jgi:hypothetical protein
MSGKPPCARSESKCTRSFASTKLTKPKKKPRLDVSFPVSDVAAFVMTAISEIVEATKGNLESYVGLMRVNSGTGSQERTDNLTPADAVDRVRDRRRPCRLLG